MQRLLFCLFCVNSMKLITIKFMHKIGLLVKIEDC